MSNRRIRRARSSAQRTYQLRSSLTRQVNYLWSKLDEKTGKPVLPTAIDWGIRKALLRRNGKRKSAPGRYTDTAAQDRYSAGRNGRRHVELTWNEEQEVLSDASERIVSKIQSTTEPIDLKQLAFQSGKYALQEYVRTRAKRGIVESLDDNDAHLVDNRSTKSGKRYRFAQADEWEKLADSVAAGQDFEDDYTEAQNLAALRSSLDSLPKRGNLRRVAIALACTDLDVATIAHCLGKEKTHIHRTVRNIKSKLPASQVERAILNGLRECLNTPIECVTETMSVKIDPTIESEQTAAMRVGRNPADVGLHRFRETAAAIPTIYDTIGAALDIYRALPPRETMTRLLPEDYDESTMKAHEAQYRPIRATGLRVWGFNAGIRAFQD